MDTEKPYMRLFNGHLKLSQASVKKMFLIQLSNIYCIKSYLVDNLPAVSVTASFNDLKNAIIESIEEIKLQLKGMDKIYDIIGETYQPRHCTGIRAMTIEDYVASQAVGMSKLETDFALLIYLQKIESLEVVCYSVLRKLAASLPEKELDQLLNENLDMAKDSKKLYELIAKEYIN